MSDAFGVDIPGPLASIPWAASFFEMSDVFGVDVIG
jgi:hypothetical protein